MVGGMTSAYCASLGPFSMVRPGSSGPTGAWASDFDVAGSPGGVGGNSRVGVSLHADPSAHTLLGSWGPGPFEPRAVGRFARAAQRVAAHAARLLIPALASALSLFPSRHIAKSLAGDANPSRRLQLPPVAAGAVTGNNDRDRSTRLAGFVRAVRRRGFVPQSYQSISTGTVNSPGAVC